MSRIRLLRKCVRAVAIAIAIGLAAGGPSARPLFPGETFLASPAAFEVFPGDFDGDGRSDLAVYSINAWRLTVLHGEGDGDFAPWAGPVSSDRVMATGDFDGDGRDDLVIWRPGGVLISRSEGTGVFSAASEIAVPEVESIVRVVASDLDDDGRLDLVVVDSAAVVRTHLGRGDGTFEQGWSLAEPLARFDIQVADFDGDGRTDLLGITGYGLEVSTFAGNGDGTFGSGRASPAPMEPWPFPPGDFNADGILDAVVTGGDYSDRQVFLLNGRGDGTFLEGDAIDGLDCTDVATGDWNADQRLDLACVGEDRKLRLRLGSEGGGFRPVFSVPLHTSAITIAAAPAGTGDALVVTAASADRFVSASQVIVFPPGPSMGAIAPVVDYPPVYGVNAAAAGDVDGDGDLDLVTFGLGILLWRNDGLGGFPGFPEAIRPASDPFGRLADMDGDGTLDLVWTDRSETGTIGVALGRGDGTFGDTIPTQPGHEFALHFDVADLDGDGRLDLAAVVGWRVVETVAFLGNGDGSFRRRPAPGSYSGAEKIVAADFDGDGRLDLAMASSWSGLSTRRGLGGGEFAPRIEHPDTWPATELVAMDLDRDGAQDLVFTRPQFWFGTVRDLWILRGDRNGGFQGPTSYPIAEARVTSMAVADWTGDGTADLVVSGAATGSALLFLAGDGVGGFGPPESFHANGFVVPGDFDDNGALDLVAAGRRSTRAFDPGTLWTLLNQRPPARPPSADAGPDEILECSSYAGAAAHFDGSGSSDPDSTPGSNDDIASWIWSSEAFGTLDGMVAETTLPLGPHSVTLTVTDRGGLASSDEAVVTVVDTTAPAGGITAPRAAACIGPDAVPVSVEDDFSDLCDPDISRVYAPNGPPPYAAHGDYAVEVVASDASGNTQRGLASFTIDLKPPVATLSALGAGWVVPGRVPLRPVLAAHDDDGATGEIVRERLFLSGCLLLDGDVEGDRDGRLVDETVTLDTAKLCAAAVRCGWTVLAAPALSFEASDCGGNRGIATHSWRGAWKLRPGLCGP